MEREIKFRAWDLMAHKMICANQIARIHFNESQPYGILDWDEGMYMKFELMQFTGLKDKNGKDAYEGDIVRYNDEIDDSTPHKALSFDPGYDGLQFLDFLSWNEFEVIGNIYENPELLNTKIK